VGGNIRGDKESITTARTASASLFTATAFSMADADQENKNLLRVLHAPSRQKNNGEKIFVFQ
jgi:hypothetical protein